MVVSAACARVMLLEVRSYIHRQDGNVSKSAISAFHYLPFPPDSKYYLILGPQPQVLFGHLDPFCYCMYGFCR